MKLRVLRPRVLFSAIALLFAATAAHAASSGNLIVGGDAEAGKCTADWSAVTTVPGWSVVQGAPSAVCYTTTSFSVPSSPSGGSALIADGPYGDSTLMQVVDVSRAATAIDGGAVTYTLSGWLGGYTVYAGEATVTLAFLDAGGKQLGTGQLGPVTASDRSYKTSLLARTATSKVPAGTRAIQVLLQFTNTSASYNIGYADNLSLTLSTPVTAAALAPPASSVPAYDHVFVVMMENTDYAAVIGDTKDAPFINGLASSGTMLADYTGTYHPSDENYLAIAGGDAFAKGATYYPNIKDTGVNLGDRLEAAGKSWKAYEQGMGTPCNTSNNNDTYYEPDDAPFINFTDISSNTTRCRAHLVDTTQFTTDLQSAATTPAFAWLAADDYYDGEASGNGSAKSLQVQDGWLNQTLTPLFNSPAWKNQRSLLILTWDESETTGTNHVATILVDSQGKVNKGYVSQASYDHYSTGRTIESALGLSSLTANDQYAEPINDAFLPPARQPTPTLSTATSSVSEGSAIAFAYATIGADLSATNWIGLYPSGVTPGSQASITWQAAPAMSGSLSFSTSGLSPGNYAAWYLYNNGYTTLAGPTAFIVTP
ncbi:MAG TPA: alkaline phosphatase family protein [Xanthomonadaceae bacterium]|jgi:hypothetical protein